MSSDADANMAAESHGNHSKVGATKHACRSQTDAEDAAGCGVDVKGDGASELSSRQFYYALLMGKICAA